jgi:hypothetical protein
MSAGFGVLCIANAFLCWKRSQILQALQSGAIIDTRGYRFVSKNQDQGLVN